MAVKFMATIKENGLGGWCIELKDTLDERIATCKDMSMFEDAIEQMGDDYGGDIEVQWSKDDNLTVEHFKEVKLAISKYQQKYDKDALA
jgi:hypothetical protein